MTSIRKAMMAAAGQGGQTYVDDVFSTYLYTGNGSTQTITNGIDLSGEGGLTWIKGRSGATDHQLFDTARGATKELISNSTAAEATDADTLTAFNSDGFALGADSNTNTNAATYASWTFRKAPKFFDVVTYTGTGANRTISHSIGTAPGMIIVKRTDTTGDWQVYHRSIANTEYLVLNSTAAKATGATRWNSTTATDAVFSLGTDATVNASGGTYVAYIFAHDTDTDEGVIQCGSYTGNGSTTGPVIDLGWEPQWLMIKNASGAYSWHVADTMRGLPASGSPARLSPDTSGAEAAGVTYGINSTGFQISDNSPNVNASGNTYIYMAIRRPNKPPESGSDVFASVTSSAGAGTEMATGFPVDLQCTKFRGIVFGNYVMDRLRGVNSLPNSYPSSSAGALNFNATNQEDGGTNRTLGFSNTGFSIPSAFELNSTIYWNFRRAPGFMDVVCYTGTGVAHTEAHNLGVAPELMIVKCRSAANAWGVYSGDNTDYTVLNTTAATVDDVAFWNDTSPTASVFTVGTNASVNTSAATYVAYLFATLAGISKVGSYTGTGTTLAIDCGFAAGARFVLIKRTDSTGDWYVWDTVRGIIAGNDPYLLLNSTAAEVTTTDYIDAYSAGFEISSTAPAAINASGGTFIFLAIA